MALPALLWLLTATGDTLFKGELAERPAKPIRAEFVSAKKPYDLELCTADIVSALGTPTVLRDGPDDVVVAASAGGPFHVAITIRATETESRLELRLLGSGQDDPMRERIHACL